MEEIGGHANESDTEMEDFENELLAHLTSAEPDAPSAKGDATCKGQDLASYIECGGHKSKILYVECGGSAGSVRREVKLLLSGALGRITNLMLLEGCSGLFRKRLFGSLVAVHVLKTHVAPITFESPVVTTSSLSFLRDLVASVQVDSLVPAPDVTLALLLVGVSASTVDADGLCALVGEALALEDSSVSLASSLQERTCEGKVCTVAVLRLHTMDTDNAEERLELSHSASWAKTPLYKAFKMAKNTGRVSTSATLVKQVNFL